MRRRGAARFVIGVAALALAACATAPIQLPPAVTLPAQWSEPPSLQAAALRPESAWWHAFHDPELDFLIARAVSANLDVQRAQASVREARALYRTSRAPRWPAIDANASALRQRESANAPAPVLPGPGGSLRPESGESENHFQGGFDASWEIDFYGARGRAMDAARADIQSSVDAHNAAVLTVTAEVARAYIELRSFQAQQIATQGMATSLEDSLALARARVTGGVAGELELVHAQALVQDVRAQAPALRALAMQSMHRLAALLALPPAALDAELGPDQPVPQVPGALPLGLPSDLLRQRPDIRMAEHRVAAAQARAGLARTDLYPKFSLLGTAGAASVAAGDFFNAASAVWSVGPMMAWPIFRGGEIRATIAVRDAQTQLALIRYRQTILAALADVENALLAYRSEAQQQNRHAEAVRTSARALELATSLYRAGHTDFRAVLAAQRTLLQARGTLLGSNTSLAINFVALCKALGGGWAADTGTVAAPLNATHISAVR